MTLQVTPKRALFLCRDNSNLSQMAEALTRIHSAGQVEVHSAGLRPARIVDPRAIASMEELGYALWHHRTKSLLEIPDVEYDVVVTMGCGNPGCKVRARRREDWGDLERSGMLSDGYREVRDGIDAQVRALMVWLYKGEEGSGDGNEIASNADDRERSSTRTAWPDQLVPA